MATEQFSGADRNGFDPFPGALRAPGPDATPGSLAQWKPLWSNVENVYNYATEVYLGTRDKTLITLLGQNGIGDRA